MTFGTILVYSLYSISFYQTVWILRHYNRYWYRVLCHFISIFEIFFSLSYRFIRSDRSDLRAKLVAVWTYWTHMAVVAVHLLAMFRQHSSGLDTVCYFYFHFTVSWSVIRRVPYQRKCDSVLGSSFPAFHYCRIEFVLKIVVLVYRNHDHRFILVISVFFPPISDV